MWQDLASISRQAAEQGHGHGGTVAATLAPLISGLRDSEQPSFSAPPGLLRRAAPVRHLPSFWHEPTAPGDLNPERDYAVQPWPAGHWSFRTAGSCQGLPWDTADGGDPIGPSGSRTTTRDSSLSTLTCPGASAPLGVLAGEPAFRSTSLTVADRCRGFPAVACLADRRSTDGVRCRTVATDSPAARKLGPAGVCTIAQIGYPPLRV